jgi:hypothetical protein
VKRSISRFAIAFGLVLMLLLPVAGNASAAPISDPDPPIDEAW